MKPERVFAYTFASIYPHYLKKVDSKGRTKDELDQVLEWLTGYDSKVGPTYELFLSRLRSSMKRPLK
jgi:hypothetical protein